MANVEEEIKAEVMKVVELQQQLETSMNSDEFQRFIKLQKDINAKAAELWKQIEAAMIEKGVKSVKGDFGSVTIAERTDFDVDILTLQPKFFSKVPNMTKIRGTYNLEGSAPKGVTARTKLYLTKKLKTGEK